VAKRFQAGKDFTIEGLLRKTVGPLCAVRNAQIELKALAETDPSSTIRRRYLLGSGCFMVPYGVALGATEADARLLMGHLDPVRGSHLTSSPV
jgi:hypothetical protein